MAQGEPTPMAPFVLIHGSWQGAWAWGPVVPLLERAGHAARAIDLPAECWPRADADVTLASIADRVAATVASLAAERGPVVLVAHSGGGVIAAEVCERLPDRIAAAVYVCAFLLRDGESIRSFYAAHQQPWMRGANRRATPSADGAWTTIAPAEAIEVFYHCSPPELARAAAARLSAQPAAPSRTPLRLSEARFGRVPRYYIEALQDRSVHLELQRAMHARQPCRAVFALDTDHAPQLSTPAALAALLIRIAAA